MINSMYSVDHRLAELRPSESEQRAADVQLFQRLIVPQRDDLADAALELGRVEIL